MGLIPSHAYAVFGEHLAQLTLPIVAYSYVPVFTYSEDVYEDAAGERRLKLYNSWYQTTAANPRPSEEASKWTFGLAKSLEEEEDDGPGIIMVSYRGLRAYFETLYLNWDPEEFEYIQAVHRFAFAKSCQSCRQVLTMREKIARRLPPHPSACASVQHPSLTARGRFGHC